MGSSGSSPTKGTAQPGPGCPPGPVPDSPPGRTAIGRRAVLASGIPLALAACTGGGPGDGSTVGPEDEAPEGSDGGGQADSPSGDDTGQGDSAATRGDAVREFVVTEHGSFEAG